MSGHGGGGHGGGGHGGGGHESSKSHGGGGHGGGSFDMEVLGLGFWKEIFTGDMTRQEKTATVLSAVALVLSGGLVPAIFTGLAGSEVIEKAREMLPEEKKGGGGGHAGGGHGGGKKGGGHH